MDIPKKEDSRTEFKTDWKDKECLPELCAFANTEGGSLFIGVNDKGRVVGIKNQLKAKKWEKSLPQIINKHLGFYPDEAEAIQTEGKTVFHIQVKPLDYLIKYNGRYYGRQGEHSRLLEGQALKFAKRNKRPKPWDEFTEEVDVSILNVGLLREKINRHYSKYDLLKTSVSSKILSDDESKHLLEKLELISQKEESQIDRQEQRQRQEQEQRQRQGKRQREEQRKGQRGGQVESQGRGQSKKQRENQEETCWKIKRAAVLLSHPKPYEIIPFACIKIINQSSSRDADPLSQNGNLLSIPLKQGSRDYDPLSPTREDLLPIPLKQGSRDNDPLSLTGNLLSQVDEVLNALSKIIKPCIVSDKSNSTEYKTKGKGFLKLIGGGIKAKQSFYKNSNSIDKLTEKNLESQTQKLLSLQVQEDLKKDFETALYVSLALKDYSISRAIEIKIYENKFSIHIPVDVHSEQAREYSLDPKAQEEMENLIRHKVDECLNETPNLCSVFEKIGFNVRDFIEKRLFPPPPTISVSNNSEKSKVLSSKQDKRAGWASLKLSPGGNFTGFKIHFDLHKWKTLQGFENTDKPLLTPNILKDTGERQTSGSKDRKNPPPSSSNNSPNDSSNDSLLKNQKKSWNKKLISFSALLLALILILGGLFALNIFKNQIINSMESINNKIGTLLSNLSNREIANQIISRVDKQTKTTDKNINKILKILKKMKKEQRFPVSETELKNTDKGKDPRSKNNLVFQDLFKICLDKSDSDDYSECKKRMEQEIDKTFCKQQ